MNFPCTKCGACCRRSYLLPSFTYNDKRTGICNKLRNNLCSVYNQRPDICIVKPHKKIAFKSTLKEYYNITAMFCNSFIIEDKMNSSYLIDLTQFKD